MSKIAKVVNILIVMYCMLFVIVVSNHMHREGLRIIEVNQTIEYSVCNISPIVEISVAIILAALFNKGKRIIKTGVI